MKVVFASYSKTGTKTMAEALRTLGYKCYDFMENYEYLGDEWMKLMTVGGTTEDIKRMLKDVDAVMDIPACIFWEEILKAFPDVKIIFCERPEHDWWISMKRQLETFHTIDMKLMRFLSFKHRKLNNWIKQCLLIGFGVSSTFHWTKPTTHNEMASKYAYRKHNSYLLQNAPKKQLHLLRLEDGWEPLCKFLGVEIPDLPFPHLNKKGSITKTIVANHPIFVEIKKEICLNICILLVLFSFGIYKLLSALYNL